ncbi:MAG: ABC transporter ATP-binding protein [bacterium]
MTSNCDFVISSRALSKSYYQGGRELKVIDSLDLDVKAGESIAIIGASGSGKTTLLNLLGGLDTADAGDVNICGRDFTPMSESERARWRNRHLGFVYQFHHLLGEFTALENVMMPMLIGKIDKKQACARAGAILEQVGLGDRQGHSPHQLSGGERQRVAIARALVTEPSCVLMDEPTGNLDPGTAEKILGLLESLQQSLQIACIVVTHDQQVASRMGRILTLREGRLASPDSIDV